jgi:hypothetical protein
MQIKKILLFLLIAVCALGFVSLATTTQAAPPQQTGSVSLTVLNPQGTIPVVNKFAPRLSSLDGKTVGLWLMMPNTFEFQPAGKAFYARITELLTKQFPNVKLVQADKFDNSPDATKVIPTIQAAKVDAAVLGIGG